MSSRRKTLKRRRKARAHRRLPSRSPHREVSHHRLHLRKTSHHRPLQRMTSHLRPLPKTTNHRQLLPRMISHQRLHLLSHLPAKHQHQVTSPSLQHPLAPLLSQNLLPKSHLKRNPKRRRRLTRLRNVRNSLTTKRSSNSACNTMVFHRLKKILSHQLPSLKSQNLSQSQR